MVLESILERSNQALSINPPGLLGGIPNNHALSVQGSNWLWAVTAIYILTLLVFISLTYFARSGEKVFHYLFTISLLTGSVAYFTMASDLGSNPIRVADNTNEPATREIFYTKYINWFVGWTPIVMAIGLLSGVSWATIIFNIALLWTWICTWLASAVTATTYKWGFFTFGLLAFSLLASSLLKEGRVSATKIGAHDYLPITATLVSIWLLYPVAYGLDDGGNQISVTAGFVFLGILDVLTVPVLSVVFLCLARGWDYDRLGLRFTEGGRLDRMGIFGPKGAEV